MMTARAAGNVRVAVGLLGLLLFALYLFLYAPIFFVAYPSISEDVVWPFPFSFSLEGYEHLFTSKLHGEALRNSIVLALGSGVLSTVLAAAGAIAILRYRSRWRGIALLLFLAPLFVADLLI